MEVGINEEEFPLLKLDKLNKLKKQNYENIAKLYLIIIDKKAGLKIKVSCLEVEALGGS